MKSPYKHKGSKLCQATPVIKKAKYKGGKGTINHHTAQSGSSDAIPADCTLILAQKLQFGKQVARLEHEYNVRSHATRVASG